MTIKAAVVQAAAGTGTPTFTQDFTDSSAGFASDVKAAIFIGSSATANHTSASDSVLSVGVAANGSGIFSHSHGGFDASAVDGAGIYSSSFAYVRTNSGFTSTGEFTINSWLSNGVRVDWADQSSSELITAVLLGGDIEASVVVATFTNAAAPETQTKAHGLSGAPEVIIAITNTDTTQNIRYSYGFWANSDYSSVAGMVNDAVAAQAVAQNAHQSAIAGRITGTANSALSISWTIANVGAANFDCIASAVTDAPVAFLCLRGTSSALVAQVGEHSTPTATGTSVLASGLTAAPTVLLTMPTRLTAVGGSTSDTAGNFGVFAAANNAGAGTQQGGCVVSSDDGANPAVEKAQSSSTQCVRILDITGAADAEAAISSWDSGGVTLNYTNVATSALTVPYLVIGQAVVGGSTQWFQYEWPHQRLARL